MADHDRRNSKSGRDWPQPPALAEAGAGHVLIGYIDEQGHVSCDFDSPIKAIMAAIPDPPVGRKLVRLYAAVDQAPAPDQTNAEVSDERLRELIAKALKEAEPKLGGPEGESIVGYTLPTGLWLMLQAELRNDLERRSVTSQASEGEPQPKTFDEWSEEDGDVVWWCWRNGEWLGEAAYIGTPLDLGQTVEIEFRTHQGEFIHSHMVGGWPGYHTHWTPHPKLPENPTS